MKLTNLQAATISRWINAVETGKPEGDYGNVTVLYDNPRGERQITYGVKQTTEAGGNLDKLLTNYVAQSRGVTYPQLKQYIGRPRYSLVDNKAFLDLLRQAGDNDPVMHEVQDKFFLEQYLKPAFDWATANGFTTALALLVIYDSFIQSGQVPWWIRRRFRESPPADGGDEKAWVTQYVQARHNWLRTWGDGKSGKSKAIRTSSYRTSSLLQLLAAGNWDMTQAESPISVNGIRLFE